MDYQACQRDNSFNYYIQIKQLLRALFRTRNSFFSGYILPLIFSAKKAQWFSIWDRGSRYSRNPSPKKLNDKMVKNIANEGNKIK